MLSRFKILVAISILLIDFSIYYILQERIVYDANHSGIYYFIIIRFIILIDLFLDFKVSKKILKIFSKNKKYREYFLFLLLIILSWSFLYSGIIGTNEFGRICSFVVQCGS